MAGVQDLVRAAVVISADPHGKIVPIKNTKGSLTRQDAMRSFVASLDAEHLRMLQDALHEAVQFGHTGQAPSHNLNSSP